ncbi:MAG: hypothetical protein K6G82_07810 [Ruminococcus sp.]|nr:hypothetical protein [Ruminococcus sp.]
MKKRPIAALAAALMSISMYTQPVQVYTAAADSETPVVSETPDPNEMSEAAVSKLNDLNVLSALFAGAPAYTEKTDDTTTNGLLLKVTDERFPTLEKVKDFINATCCFGAKEHFESQLADCFDEKDGALYVKRKLTDYFTAPTSEGVTLTRTAETEFTAVTKAFSEMNGYCKAKFYKDSDWLISDYGFCDSPFDTKSIVCEELDNLNMLMGVLNAAPAYTDTEDQIKTDGDKTYVRVKNAPLKTYDEFKSYVRSIAAAPLSDSLIEQAGSSFIIENGKLYVENRGVSFPVFDTQEGVELKEETEDSLTAVPTAIDELYGKKSVYFVKADGIWLIKDYEVGEKEGDLHTIAKQKMDDLSTILAIMNASPQYTEPINDEYAKITDTRFNMLYDFHVLVEATVYGDLRNDILVESSENIVDINGSLCVKRTGRSFYIFRTQDGVELSDTTRSAFTATTIAGDELYGKGTANFIWKDNEWFITDYRFGGEQPVLSLGDSNGDSKIDAKDASFVLVEYSKMSTGADSELTEAQKAAADVNDDGKIDAKDSSYILSYYAFASTAAGDVPTLKEYLTQQAN